MDARHSGTAAETASAVPPRLLRLLGGGLRLMPKKPEAWGVSRPITPNHAPVAPLSPCNRATKVAPVFYIGKYFILAYFAHLAASQSAAAHRRALPSTVSMPR